MSQHKLLVFAGPCVEQTGELMLQTGCFSLRDFIQIFTDKEVCPGTVPVIRPLLANPRGRELWARKHLPSGSSDS